MYSRKIKFSLAHQIRNVIDLDQESEEEDENQLKKLEVLIKKGTKYEIKDEATHQHQQIDAKNVDEEKGDVVSLEKTGEEQGPKVHFDGDGSSSEQSVTDSDCSKDEMGKDVPEDPSAQIKTAIQVKLWNKLFDSYAPEVTFNKPVVLRK